MRRIWPRVSLEVLARYTRRDSARQLGWVVLGVLGAVLIVAWAMMRPFEVREGFETLRRGAVLLVAWYVLFAELFVISTWLAAGRAQKEEDDLAHLPLSALQFFWHRAAALCTVPLLTLLLSLPLFGVLLLYVGVPYGQELDGTFHVVRAHYKWVELPNPWAWRMGFTALNLVSAVLLPLALALLLSETVRWAPLRVILLPAVTIAAYFVIERGGEFFYPCYKLKQGLSPWPFALILAVLILLPLLIGWLRPRGRAALAVIVALVCLAFALLPWLQYQLPGTHTTAMIKDALGDGRFALGYYVGHLSPVENIKLVLTSYASAVLFKGEHPWRISLWVGAGLYPPLLALWTFLGLSLGIALRRRAPPG